MARVGPRTAALRSAGVTARLARLGLAVLVLTAAPVAAADADPPTTTAPPATTTTAPPTTTTTTAPPTSTTAPPTSTTAAPPSSTTTAAPGSPTTTVLPAPTTTAPPEGPASTVPDPGVERQVAPVEGDASGLSAEEIAGLLRLQQDYESLVGLEASTLADLWDRIRRIEELDADLARTDADLARTERELVAARATVIRIERERQSNLAAQRRTARALEQAQDRLRQQAIDAFVGGANASARQWEVVLDADNANTAGIVLTYAGVVIDIQQATIVDVETLEGELETIGHAIESSREEADAARDEVEKIEERLRSHRVDTQAERDRVESERVELDASLAAIRDRKAAYDRQLRTMAIESDNITNVLARAQRDQQRAASIPPLRTPLDPLVRGSGFGPRLHPIFGTVRQHNGVDLSGAMGDPIRAVEAGTVVMAETRNGFGSTIVIDHGDRLASLYAHLSRFEISVGDRVERGELIGRVGSTGWSTGPHLHLELRLEGVAVDPGGYLVPDEPVDCAVLTASDHPIDQALLAQRPDCG